MSTLRKKLLATARRSSFLADCISGWKMYQHTKTHHVAEQNIFAESFFGRERPHVLGGVFQGMIYENRTYFGPVTPRWIGSYEKELAPIIAGLVQYKPERIIDVGAAEGYYSIGLARMFPAAKVFSYETNPLSLLQQGALKRLNKTWNLSIKRYCHQRDLCHHGQYRCFILSDIEGGEFDLFSPEVISRLDKALVLIELHGHQELDANSVGAVLEARFQSSHSITYITPSPRTAADIEIALPADFGERMLVSAMNEVRSIPQKWMYCVPRELKRDASPARPPQ